MKRDVPRGSLLGRPLFRVYIKDLPKISNDNSNIVLFADDTSVIITNPNPTNFKNILIRIFQDIINSWLVPVCYH